MTTAYIVEAVRTAGGRRGGRLAGVHPVDLLARALDAIVERSGIDPAVVEDVITGCVSQAGEQALQVGRMGVLASRLLPQSTPAVTIDRQCGSSQQAIQFAAQAVMSGTQDVVIASGVESMTRVPMGSNVTLHIKDCARPPARHIGHEADGNAGPCLALRAQGKKYGLQTMCEGGGVANVTIIEAL